MAIGYRGFADRSGTLGADPAVDLSAIGLTNNDFMVGVCRAGGAIVPPVGGGWTTSPASLGLNNPLVWRKWATGDPTSFTFVTTGAVNSVVGIGVWSGVHTTSPVDDSDGFDGTGALVVPSVDSAGSDRWLATIAVKLGNTTMTFAGGGERWDHLSATQNFVTAGADETIAVGATGSRTVTPASGGANGVAYMLALRPATTAYTVSSDLVGAGVPARDVIVLTMGRDVVGDGVVSRQFAETTARDLTGDGAVTRGLAQTTVRDLSGVGTVAVQVGAGIPRDVVGDGTVTRSVVVTVDRGVAGDGTVSRGGMAAGVLALLEGAGVVDGAKAVVAAKTFDLVGDGVITETHTSGLLKSFDLTGDGTISGSANIPFPIIPECAPDWSPNDGLKTISGAVFDHEDGSVVAGATVCLVRDSDAFQVECTTSAGDGSYSFPRDTNDPYTYHVVSTTATQQGMSEPGCAPS